VALRRGRNGGGRAGVAVVLLGLPAVHPAGAAGVVAVHAVDYSYQGVPGSLPAVSVQ